MVWEMGVKRALRFWALGRGALLCAAGRKRESTTFSSQHPTPPRNACPPLEGARGRNPCQNLVQFLKKVVKIVIVRSPPPQPRPFRSEACQDLEPDACTKAGYSIGARRRGKPKKAPPKSIWRGFSLNASVSFSLQGGFRSIHRELQHLLQ